MKEVKKKLNKEVLEKLESAGHNDEIAEAVIAEASEKFMSVPHEEKVELINDLLGAVSGDKVNPDDLKYITAQANKIWKVIHAEVSKIDIISGPVVMRMLAGTLLTRLRLVEGLSGKLNALEQAMVESDYMQETINEMMLVAEGIQTLRVAAGEPDRPLEDFTPEWISANMGRLI